MATGKNEHDVENGRHLGPMFDPPLYLQRYVFVSQWLMKHNVTSVVDFGSAEAKLCRFLVQVPSIQEISLVDIDSNLLTSNIYAIKPMASDYIKRRAKSLVVRMYCGSVTDYDKAIVGCDAVTLIELIEHLHPDVLQAACANIFGALQPSLVIMTTPNADFNQLFTGFTGMRHWDHKFEWTRTEFQQWCFVLSQQYGYTVEFSGVGEPPPGAEIFGHCSQAAIFVRGRERTATNYIISKSYQLIAERTYPYLSEPISSSEETLRLEIDHLLHQYRLSNGCDVLNESLEGNGIYSCLVPLSYLLRCKQLKDIITETQLRAHLAQHGYRLSKDSNHVVLQDLSKEPCSDADSDADTNNTCSVHNESAGNTKLNSDYHKKTMENQVHPGQQQVITMDELWE